MGSLSKTDEDILRYVQLVALDSPRDRDIASFRRWMDAVKPLIKDESRFFSFTDDLVTVHQDHETGVLEEAVERMVRKTGIGRTVSPCSPGKLYPRFSLN